MDLGLAIAQHLAPSVHLGLPRLLQWPVSPCFRCLSSFSDSRKKTSLNLYPPLYSHRWVVIPLYLIYDSGKVILSALDRQQEGKKTA